MCPPRASSHLGTESRLEMLWHPSDVMSFKNMTERRPHPPRPGHPRIDRRSSAGAAPGPVGTALDDSPEGEHPWARVIPSSARTAALERRGLRLTVRS